jgi:hypothetical protein
VLKEYGVIPSESAAEAKILEYLVALEKDPL